MVLHKKSLTSIDQIDLDDLKFIFNTADVLEKSKRTELLEILKGYTLTNLFYEPSTRTSSSFYSAASKMGMSVIPINEVNYSSVIKGETLEDTIRTLECYSDIIVLRHGENGAAERAANIAKIPVINAGDGTGEHPTQALLDLYTIQKEKGGIDGLTITMMGDLKHGRTVHSLVKLLKNYDVKINFISPAELSIPYEYSFLINRSYQSNEIKEVIAETDVLYMTRVQKERLPEHLKIDYNYGINSQLMAQAKKDMVLLHPLPRVGEITTELDLDPRSAYFRQVQNGLWIRMALLKLILVG